MKPSNSIQTESRYRALRAPRFWRAPPRTPGGRCVRALARPLTGFYRSGLVLHQWYRRSRAKSLAATVISIGNLVVGGTGKTPVALWIAEQLQRRGRAVAILSRGYGRTSRTVGRVPTAGKASELGRQFGDEPVMMALKCRGVPVWVGSTRWLSGDRAIREDGVSVLILDDGFQHLALKRDLDLVLLDAVNPFGNGCLLPFGPLREPVSHLARAHAFVVMDRGEPAAVAATEAYLRSRFPDRPVFVCRKNIQTFTIGLTTEEVSVHRIRSRTAVAFAGIAHPQRFFHALSESGICLQQTLAFPDHHSYAGSDLERILRAVEKHDAAYLITTEKDMVRLPPWLCSATVCAGLNLAFTDGGTGLVGYLLNRING